MVILICIVLCLPSDATPPLQVEEESRAGRNPSQMALYSYPFASQHCLALHSHSFHQTANFPPELLVPNLETTALGLARFLVGLRTGGCIISRVVGEILMRHQNVAGLENWWQRI